MCPFCQMHNNFPEQYRDMSEQNLPAEVFGQYTTIEYEQRVPPQAPVIIFCVDLCLELETELQAVKDAIIQSLNLIPGNFLVGLVTFGTYVRVPSPSHPPSFCVCLSVSLQVLSWDIPPLLCKVVLVHMVWLLCHCLCL